MARSFCLRVFAFPFGAFPKEDLSRTNHPINHSLVWKSPQKECFSIYEIVAHSPVACQEFLLIKTPLSAILTKFLGAAQPLSRLRAGKKRLPTGPRKPLPGV